MSRTTVGFRLRPNNPVDQIIAEYLKERNKRGHDLSDIVREQMEGQLKASGDWERIKKKLGISYG